MYATAVPVTKEVWPIRYSHPGVRDIVLVDTPGCNDSMTDFQGKDYFKNVTFVTTMWDQVSEEVGWEREQDLRSDFWREMINLGSTTHRFEGTTELACRRSHYKQAFLPLVRFEKVEKSTKRRRFEVAHPTRIAITLSDDPIANLSTGTELFGLSSSGSCSAEGYRSSLAQVISALRATTSVPELLHLRYIRDAITVCLVIALSIEPMTGTHRGLFHGLEVATLLINMVVEHFDLVSIATLRVVVPMI
ncbi:hypothetical protein PISMIDRAFT_16616 [Pisolithus microcarpus 441]|uniref:G domain-containing protein n=1 Tax=Pisolithus microcarpus 441 TaxID=765257 RepID=A0A0C9Z5N0_9AGAM|nr:hypothetical protein BKA83DRAFT_16616 [Pisolithus microcarpus]KIK15293.1 hypothetical protein PISMIDRAFT_16616 [Pisolithus microcarpus 441]